MLKEGKLWKMSSSCMKLSYSPQKTDTLGMLLKLDLSKVFDKISWAYMTYVLLAFGFAPAWVYWLLKLTSSSFFSIIINGDPSHPFSPTHEIRQGHPLSPFLFIIMEEGLSYFIKDSIADRSLVGIPLHGIDPSVSHNKFFDDTLMLGSPMVQEAQKIPYILQTFCASLGMEINRDKSKIFFFNTALPVQLHITTISGLHS
jgi:hypothetical protein